MIDFAHTTRNYLSLGNILARCNAPVYEQIALVIEGDICIGVHLDDRLVFATVCHRVQARLESILCRRKVNRLSGLH